MAKKLFGGKESYSEELKEAKALKSGKISEKGFVKGEKSEGHKDEEKNPALLARAIKSGKKTPEQYATEEAQEMKKGGKTKCMAAGGVAKDMPSSKAMGSLGLAKGGMARRPTKGEHSVQKKAKQGAEVIKMAKGGYVKAADGCASKGKTKGTMVSMCGGGMYKKGK